MKTKILTICCLVLMFTKCSKDDSMLQIDSPMTPTATTKSLATFASATTLSIKPEKLFYLPGNVIKFTGKVTNILGQGIYGIQVEVDDPIRLFCTLTPKTDLLGNFTYTSTIPSSAKGIYGFAFYCNNLKSFITVEVTPSIGLNLKNRNHQIPLGIATLTTSFDMSSLIKIPTIYGFPKSTIDQRRQTADKVGSFMAGVVSNSLSDYVSNPVNDVVSVAAIGCAAGIWTGVGTIPCSALYTFIVIQSIKSTLVGTSNTIIDKTSMSSTNKAYWKEQIKLGKCVFGIFTIDPSSAIASVSSVGTGWSCASAIATAYSTPKKSIKIVATPTSTSTNQSIVGMVLIVKQ
jgi:hypothetical protein